MNAQVFMEAMGQVDTKYVKEVLSVKVPYYKRAYLAAAAFVVLIVMALALCIGSITRNPEVTELIQVPYLKEYLGGNRFFDLTAEVGDDVYDIWKTDSFAEVLDPDSWVETKAKTGSEDPLVTLNFGPVIHYTFYPDGYVYALYSGEIRSAYVPVKKDTWYQTPEELPQELLEYVLENGVNYEKLVSTLPTEE